MNAKLKKITIRLSKIAIYMYCCCFSVSMALATGGTAQKKLFKEINVQVSTASTKLVDLFSDLEQSTEFTFVYFKAELKDRPIVLKKKRWSMEELLKEASVQTRVSFKRVNEIITVRAVESAGSLPVLQESLSMAFTVSGKVTDEKGEPLPGATILEKGTTNGTVTDINGEYNLNVTDENAVLVISFVGYSEEEIAVGGRNTIDVQMYPDLTSLQEIVVIGYGQVNKSDLTGSVVQVKPEDLTALPVINAVQGLTGRAAGVQVIQNSGEPGGNISVRIRGGNSITAGNEPLYVVDGFPLNGAPTVINPSDIASVEVLKDASATAIYGSRGANGVVMITTKKGRAGESRIDVESYFGFQEVRETIDLLNARQFAEIANLRAENDGQQPFFSDEEINSFGEGTDWQDEIFRTAPIQNHVVTFSGGNEKSQYSISGSIFDQDGIIENTDYWRGSIRANFIQEISEVVKLSSSTVLSRINQNSQFVNNGGRGNSVLSGALASPPVLSPRNENGEYTDFQDELDFLPTVLINPVARINEQTNERNTNSILTNMALDFSIVEGLTFKVSGGLQYNNTKRDQYTTSALEDLAPEGNARTTFTERLNLLNENILTYQGQFGPNHNLVVIGGFTYQSDRFTNNFTDVSGFATDELLNNNLESGTTINRAQADVTEWTLLSWLGRVNYDLKGKYLFTASFRTDGSSRFGENNKWSTFPSAAFAWRAGDEQFINDLGVFSNLKLRTSWGFSGNTAINPYTSLNTLNGGQTVFNNELVSVFAPGNREPNPGLKWETTRQYDIGADFGFVNDRIRLSVDYYHKRTEDLLVSIALPPSSGFTSRLENIGIVENKGWEFDLGSTIVETDAFTWDANLNLSVNRNEVVRISDRGANDENRDLFGVRLPAPLGVSVSLTREGEPLGVFYGFREAGLNDQGEILYFNSEGDVTTTPTQTDRSILGDPNPGFIFGLNNDFKFKNFELNVFIQGVQGNDIFNANLADHANSFNIGANQIAEVVNNWTPANTTAPYPILSENTDFLASDRFVEDGSFLRLRNIRLAYNLPTERLGMDWLRNAQFYISGQNLITITGYSWFDPEINSRGGSTSRSPGIDQTGYPVARTYTFGVKLGF